MHVTPEILAQAKQLAQENYLTWGQWVVECFEDSELINDLEEFKTVDEWVKKRKTVAEVYEGYENSENW